MKKQLQTLLSKHELKLSLARKTLNDLFLRAEPSYFIEQTQIRITEYTKTIEALEVVLKIITK